MCTCSLIPSARSSDCSALSPLARGARVPSLSAQTSRARAASRGPSRAPSRRGRAHGAAWRRSTSGRRFRCGTGGARRRPARARTARRGRRRTSRGRARSRRRRGCRLPCTRSPEARGAARPSTSPRRPRGPACPAGFTKRSSSSENECSLAPQFLSSQPRSRLRNGSAASTSSSGRYQSWLRASFTQPSISARFSRIPGSLSSSRRGIPFIDTRTKPPPQSAQIERARRQVRERVEPPDGTAQQPRAGGGHVQYRRLV